MTEKLLAPNGKPSNLNSVQWKQVRTKEFKKWFGDWENNPKSASKMLDENGEPLVVYRGNLKDYGAEFRYGVKNIPNKWRVDNTVGFFFTTDKSDAKRFTGTAGGNTQAVFLNVRDNVNLSSDNYNKADDLFKELEGVSVHLRKETKEAIKSYLDDIEEDYPVDTFKFLDGGGELLRKDFEASGVDGVFFNEYGLSGIVGCVFHPNQIKSATGNSGMFNPKSNDITAAVEKLLAPNGKPSNLNSVQWKQVRTPEFKAWFGDWEKHPEKSSKIIDENGEPLICYHGTNKGFSGFDSSKIGTNTQNEGYYGKGFYFAFDPDRAVGYGSKIIPVFLNVRKPLENNGDSLKPIAKEMGVKVRGYEIKENGFSAPLLMRYLTNSGKKGGLLTKVAEDKGYDGAISAMELSDIFRGSSQEIVVFNPNQIKFASTDRDNLNLKSKSSTDTEKLLAPNGKPSNLNAVQWKQVRTKEFKKWFGDWETKPESASKVVDNNGEPLICYHGSPLSFDEFQPNSWFTTDPNDSSTYSTMAIPGKPVLPQTYPVFLNIRRPKLISQYILKSEAEAQLNKLKSDSGFIINQGSRKHFVVKNPNQIKSAVGNKGTFGKSNSILSSLLPIDFTVGQPVAVYWGDNEFYVGTISEDSTDTDILVDMNFGQVESISRKDLSDDPNIIIPISPLLLGHGSYSVADIAKVRVKPIKTSKVDIENIVGKTPIEGHFGSNKYTFFAQPDKDEPGLISIYVELKGSFEEGAPFLTVDGVPFFNPEEHLVRCGSGKDLAAAVIDVKQRLKQAGKEIDSVIDGMLDRANPKYWTKFVDKKDPVKAVNTLKAISSWEKVDDKTLANILNILGKVDFKIKDSFLAEITFNVFSNKNSSEKTKKLAMTMYEGRSDIDIEENVKRQLTSGKLTLDNYKEQMKSLLGDNYKDFASGIENEWYDGIANFVKVGGTITQEVFDSMTDGQRNHFQKNYNSRNDKVEG